MVEHEIITYKEKICLVFLSYLTESCYGGNEMYIWTERSHDKLLEGGEAYEKIKVYICIKFSIKYSYFLNIYT